MKIRKELGIGQIRSLRNTTIYRFIGRTVAVYNSCYRTTGKEIREKDRFRKREVWKSKLCARLYRKPSICPAPHQTIHRNAEKRRTKSQREGEERSTVECFLRKPYWRSEIRLEELRCFQNFLLMIDSKTLER